MGNSRQSGCFNSKSNTWLNIVLCVLKKVRPWREYTATVSYSPGART